MSGAEEVTRDFAYGEKDPLTRKCMLLPWFPADLQDISPSTPEPPDQHYQVGPPRWAWKLLECSRLPLGGGAGASSWGRSSVGVRLSTGGVDRKGLCPALTA